MKLHLGYTVEIKCYSVVNVDWRQQASKRIRNRVSRGFYPATPPKSQPSEQE